MQYIYLIDNKVCYTSNINDIDFNNVQCFSKIDHPEIILNLLDRYTDSATFHKVLYEYLSLNTGLTFSKYIAELAIKAGRKSIKSVEDVLYAIAYDLFGSNYESGVIFTRDVNKFNNLYIGLQKKKMLECRYSDIAIINPYTNDLIKHMKLKKFDLSSINCRDDIIDFYNNKGFEINQLYNSYVHANHFNYDLYEYGKLYTPDELVKIFDSNARVNINIEYFVTGMILSNFNNSDINNIHDCYKPFVYNTYFYTKDNNFKVYTMMYIHRNELYIHLNNNLNYKMILVEFNKTYIPVNVINTILPNIISRDNNIWNHEANVDKKMNINCLFNYKDKLPVWIDKNDKDIYTKMLNETIFTTEDQSKLITLNEYLNYYSHDIIFKVNLCYTLLQSLDTNNEAYNTFINKFKPTKMKNENLVASLYKVEDNYKKIYGKDLTMTVKQLAESLDLSFIF